MNKVFKMNKHFKNIPASCLHQFIRKGQRIPKSFINKIYINISLSLQLIHVYV